MCVCILERERERKDAADKVKIHNSYLGSLSEGHHGNFFIFFCIKRQTNKTKQLRMSEITPKKERKKERKKEGVCCPRDICGENRQQIQGKEGSWEDRKVPLRESAGLREPERPGEAEPAAPSLQHVARSPDLLWASRFQLSKAPLPLDRH